ncbi:phosphoesterase PA-phosphatase, partial [Cereibacter changlensis]
MRRGVLSCLIVLLWALPQAGAAAATDRQAMQGWYRLVLELVRHTPTYSPPVASRAFAYLGVTGYEALASGDPALRSLSGQLTDLDPLPAREPGLAYDDEAVVQAALARSVAVFFENTGPT